MLDRFLVLAEAGGIGAAICLNKIDLGVPHDVDARMDVYRSIGYQVVLASAERRLGFAEIQELLAGKTSAFVGPSGVGKSSLLRGIEPAYDPRVLAISESTGKGRHTTTGTRLFPLSGLGGGYLADTAGLRELAVSCVDPEDLPACFREFKPYLGQCRLPRCSHLHEPNCAIRGALSARKIDPIRYRSYRRIRAGTA
jgi:ribosome biogenesis GTPase